MFNVPIHVAGLAWLAVVQVVYVLLGVTVQGPFLPCTISWPKKNLPSHEPSSISVPIPHFVFQFPRPQLACHSPAIIVTAPVWSVQSLVSSVHRPLVR
jgi:hypothetical protein